MPEGLPRPLRAAELDAGAEDKNEQRVLRADGQALQERLMASWSGG